MHRNWVPVFCHLDLDCFYCQVEHRRLGVPRDHPLAVQQIKCELCLKWNRVIAVNYAARAYGVKRGDSVPVVKAKCPSVKLVHVETLTCNSQGKACDGSPRQPNRKEEKVTLQRYRNASAEVLSLLFDFCRGVEKASVDEVYVDLSRHVAVMIQWLLAVENIGEARGLESTSAVCNEASVEQGVSQHSVDQTSNDEINGPATQGSRSQRAVVVEREQGHSHCTLFPFSHGAPPLPELTVQRSLLPLLKERLFDRTEIKDPGTYRQIAGAARRFVPLNTSNNGGSNSVSGPSKIQLLSGTGPQATYTAEQEGWGEKAADGTPYSFPLSDDEWTLENFWLVCGAVLAARLRREVEQRLGFTMSGGLAHNKFVAKVASAYFKPNQQVIVPEEHVTTFLAGVEFKKMPGMGGKRGQYVAGCFPSLKFVGQMQQLPLALLRTRLGKEEGDFVFNLLRGTPEGCDSVQCNVRVKSMLAFKSLPSKSAGNEAEVKQWMSMLAEELHQRATQDFQLYGRIPKTLSTSAILNADVPTAPPDAKKLWDMAVQLWGRLKAEQIFLEPCSRIALCLADFCDVGEAVAGKSSKLSTITDFFPTTRSRKDERELDSKEPRAYPRVVETSTSSPPTVNKGTVVHAEERSGRNDLPKSLDKTSAKEERDLRSEGHHSTPSQSLHLISSDSSDVELIDSSSCSRGTSHSVSKTAVEPLVLDSESDSEQQVANTEKPQGVYKFAKCDTVRCCECGAEVRGADLHVHREEHTASRIYQKRNGESVLQTAAWKSPHVPPHVVPGSSRRNNRIKKRQLTLDGFLTTLKHRRSDGG